METVPGLELTPKESVTVKVKFTSPLKFGGGENFTNYNLMLK